MGAKYTKDPTREKGVTFGIDFHYILKIAF